MTPERIAELQNVKSTKDPTIHEFLLAWYALPELLTALEAVTAERDRAQEEYEGERKFIEQIETALGADCRGSIGSGILQKIGEINAERLRWERPAARWRKMRKEVGKCDTAREAVEIIDRIADIPDAELEPKPLVKP